MRDREIARLQDLSHKNTAGTTHSVQQAQQISNLNAQIDAVLQEKGALQTELSKEKSRCQLLTQENTQMTSVVDKIKSGEYSTSEGARVVAAETTKKMQQDIDELQSEITALTRENRQLKQFQDKNQSAQSAFQSD